MSAWKCESTIVASGVARGMWVTLDRAINDGCPGPRKVSCTHGASDEPAVQICFEGDYAASVSIRHDAPVYIWVHESPHKAESPDAEPLGYEYIMRLDALDASGADFLIDIPSERVIPRPAITLPREHWEALGRPRAIAFTVKAANP